MRFLPLNMKNIQFLLWQVMYPVTRCTIRLASVGRTTNFRSRDKTTYHMTLEVKEAIILDTDFL